MPGLLCGVSQPCPARESGLSLDHITNGRFELGLGAGWHAQEAAAYGYDFPSIGTRLDMLDEAAAIISSLLTQPRTTFQGTHFSVQNASNLPRPLNPKLPIWIGGLGPKKTLRIVAQRATGWNAAYVSPEQFGHLNQTLNQWCERLDRDPTEIERSVNLSFHLGLTEADLKAEQARIDSDWGPQAARIRAGSLVCTPSQAIDKILAYHQQGASLINIALRAPWREDALDRYLNEVMPAVRAAAV